MSVRVPKILRDLAAESGPPRELSLPERTALCRIVKRGLRRPYPGVEIQGCDLMHDTEEDLQWRSADVFSTAYFVEVARGDGLYTCVVLLTRRWNVNFRGSPPVLPKNMAHAVALFGLQRLNIRAFDRFTDLPSTMRPSDLAGLSRKDAT